MFYEPWFLGLGVLVTLGTLHYNRRSGGSVRAGRRLVTITAAATLVLTLFSCTLVVASNGDRAPPSTATARAVLLVSEPKQGDGLIARLGALSTKGGL